MNPLYSCMWKSREIRTGNITPFTGVVVWYFKLSGMVQNDSKILLARFESLVHTGSQMPLLLITKWTQTVLGSRCTRPLARQAASESQRHFLRGRLCDGSAPDWTRKHLESHLIRVRPASPQGPIRARPEPEVGG